MSIDTVRTVLAWCTLVDWLLLFFWWALFALAGDRIFALHTKWFRISRETFDAIHYAGMALFKMLIFLFNLVPYLVLRLLF